MIRDPHLATILLTMGSLPSLAIVVLGPIGSPCELRQDQKVSARGAQALRSILSKRRSA